MLTVKPKYDYFSDEALRSGLKSKTVRGAAVTGLTQLIRVGIGLASIPLLARLLEPSDFGLFATIAVVTNFALMFVDAGMSMATIQRDKITRSQISNLFWIATSLGFVLAAAVSAIGPLLGWLYGEPRLIWLTVVTSLSYVFTGLTIQHQAILRRCMLFSRISIIEILSLLIGQVAALAWAWKFYRQPSDYWALAMIPLVSSATRMVGVWLACHWVPNLPTRGSESRELIRFGSNLTSGQAFNYLSANVDLLVVGYFFGDAMLGNYERSTTLALQPVRQVNGPLTSVCVPALSRLIDSPKKYYHAFRIAVTLVGMMMVPIAAVCVVDADVLIRVLMGEGWETAVPIFRVLSLGLIGLPICNSSTWLLISQGRGREIFQFQLVDAMAKVAMVACAIPFGPIGIAVACSLRSIAMPIFLFPFIGRSGQVSTGKIWSIFGIQILAMAVSSMSLALLRRWSFDSVVHAAPSQQLALSVVIAVATSTAVFSAFRFVRHGVLDVVVAFHNLQPTAT